MSKASKKSQARTGSAAQQSIPKDASTAAGRTGSKAKGSAKKGGRAAPSKKQANAPDPQPRKGISGVPGSLHPERRCSATARRTGNQCRRAAIKGGTVCMVHGGNLPQVRGKAKERLLALVDPALVALNKVLTDPDADDATKVRAALGVLDRTGFKPGMTLEVGVSKFDALALEALGGVKPTLDGIKLDRAMLGGHEDPTIGWEDVDQHQHDAQVESWREFDAEDEEPWSTRLDPYDGNTVRGEVMSDSLLPDPSKNPVGPTEMTGGVRPAEKRPHNAPPRYVDE